jgi:hypothetical protein
MENLAATLAASAIDEGAKTEGYVELLETLQAAARAGDRGRVAGRLPSRRLRLVRCRRVA